LARFSGDDPGGPRFDRDLTSLTRLIRSLALMTVIKNLGRQNDPPLEVGTIYPSMKEFRAAVKHHAIKAQFEIGTEKSCRTRFRGYCKAKGCPWSIVGRLMADEKQVRVCCQPDCTLSATSFIVSTYMLPICY
jgi:hypothetical protein